MKRFTDEHRFSTSVNIVFALAALVGVSVPGVCSICLAADPAEAHWSYDRYAKDGPDKWGKSFPDANGKEQSPVELVDGPDSHEFFSVQYGDADVENLSNNGHTWQVNFTDKGGGTLHVGQREFKLVQFHFHSPSEHTRHGTATAMEVHLVHSDGKMHERPGGHLAVIGVRICQGEKANAFLARFWNQMPNHEADVPPRGDATKLDAAGLLPPGHKYQTYAGSLTTPPCSQGVTWIVAAEPIEASAEQIAAFRKAMKAVGQQYYTVRPVQPLYQRSIKWIGRQ